MYLLLHQPCLISNIMERLSPSPLLLLFTLFTFIATINCTESISYDSSPIQDDPHDVVCTLPVVYCGQGKCRYSSNSSHSVDVPFIGPVGFDCDCDPGWKKIDIQITANLSYPTCLLPDCTIDFGCNNSSPLPPTPFSAPPSDVSQCFWCGEGTCEADATLGYRCQCNAGASNLFDNPLWPCFKACSLGADCKKLALSPSDSNAAPSSKTTGVLNCLRNLNAVTMLLLTSIFLAWI